MVMTRSSFLVGLLAASFGVPLLAASPAAAEDPPSPAVREIEVLVDGGYKPARIAIPEGERVRLKFVRKDYSPCTREVVFASLGIRRELPTDVPVVIELAAQAPGEIPFACGMNMVKGVIVVEPRK